MSSRLQRKTAGYFIALVLTGFFTLTYVFRYRLFAGSRFGELVPVLTLDSIFRKDHSWIGNLDDTRIITLIGTGDIIPARSVNSQVVSRGDFLWPYRNIAPLLSSANLTVINFETPLVTGCQITTEGMTFCGDPKNIEGLVYSGVDIANLANNHTANYGQAGLLETIGLLNKNKIEYSGLNHTAYLEVKGVKFAFLGYNDLVPGNSVADMMKTDVARARKNADVVVVSFHWGVEYTSVPTDRQISLAHLAIDSGASLVLGNHPHWIQPVETYHGKLMVYAQGNTVFDQMWSDQTQTGVIGKYTFYDRTLIDAEFIPIKIRDYGQPYILSGAERTNVLKNMETISRNLPEVFNQRSTAVMFNQNN